MEMPPDETTTEEKSSRSYWGFVLWPLAVFVLYALSIGPAMLGVRKGIISWKVLNAYTPLWGVVHAASLDKPCRIYLHFWSPGDYDKNGDLLGLF